MASDRDTRDSAYLKVASFLADKCHYHGHRQAEKPYSSEVFSARISACRKHAMASITPADLSISITERSWRVEQKADIAASTVLTLTMLKRRQYALIIKLGAKQCRQFLEILLKSCRHATKWLQFHEPRSAADDFASIHKYHTPGHRHSERAQSRCGSALHCR